jgi:HK97 family phage portal protein
MKTVPRWANPKRKIRSASAPDFRLSSQMAFPTIAGPAINEQTAMTIVAVYNAVTIISNAFALLDIGVAEKIANGGRRPATELPLFDKLARSPNPRNTAFNFRRSTMVHALTSGNGYWEIEWAGREVKNFHLLEPRNVTPRDDEQGNLVYRLERERKDLKPENIIHLANLGWDGVRGYSPVALAREALGLSKAQETYASGLMGNSAQPGGYLKVSNKLKEVDKNRLRTDFEGMHQGAENAGTIGILDGGMEWVQTAFSPADAELLLSRAFSVAEIARLFNIPQHMIGLLEHATFSNIEHQLLEFYTFTLLPWITNLEQQLDVKVFSRMQRVKYFIFHEFSSLLRADTATMIAQDTADFKIGVASENDILRRRGKNPIDNPNADKHYIEANNMVAIEDMGKDRPPRPDAPDLVVDPDEESQPEAKPEPLADDETREALRDVLLDTIHRAIRSETAQLRSAAKREARFDLWSTSFYERRQATTDKSIEPAIRLLSRTSGRPFNAGDVARSMAEDSAEQLRDLYTTFPPDELPDAVERLATLWESNRVGSIVDALMTEASKAP